MVKPSSKARLFLWIIASAIAVAGTFREYGYGVSEYLILALLILAAVTLGVRFWIEVKR